MSAKTQWVRDWIKEYQKLLDGCIDLTAQEISQSHAVLGELLKEAIRVDQEQSAAESLSLAADQVNAMADSVRNTQSSPFASAEEFLRKNLPQLVRGEMQGPIRLMGLAAMYWNSPTLDREKYANLIDPSDGRMFNLDAKWHRSDIQSHEFKTDDLDLLIGEVIQGFGGQLVDAIVITYVPTPEPLYRVEYITIEVTA